MPKRLHPSLLPLIFCAAVIIVDVAAFATGKITKPETAKTWSTTKTADAEPLLIDFKTDFKERIQSALPDESEGLALGYLLGDKSELGATLKETIATVGLTHLIVASGAHLGIILKFVKKSFGRISRAVGLLAGLAAVALFIGIIGLTPSALRSGLVAILSLMATHLGRDLKPTRLLLYAAAATLLIDPTYPLNLSWLLSFASFTAVLLVAPALETYFYGPETRPAKSAETAETKPAKPAKTKTKTKTKTNQPSTLASLLLASLAATLLTAPILLFYFGQISLISVLTNLLISPTLALTMLLTFLTGLVPNPVTALGAHLLVQYHIAVASALADQTAFLVTLDKNNPLVFLLYLPLLLVALFLYHKNKISIAKTKALC